MLDERYVSIIKVQYRYTTPKPYIPDIPYHLFKAFAVFIYLFYLLLQEALELHFIPILILIILIVFTFLKIIPLIVKTFLKLLSFID